VLTVAQEVLDNKVYPKQPERSPCRYSEDQQLCSWKRVCVRSCPRGSIRTSMHTVAIMCVCVHLFSWAFRTKRAGLFVVLHEPALGLSLGSLTHPPPPSSTVLPQGSRAVTLSTLSTTILLLIPGLNSSFGHTACS